jgi:hypothetical protein
MAAAPNMRAYWLRSIGKLWLAGPIGNPIELNIWGSPGLSWLGVTFPGV